MSKSKKNLEKLRSNLERLQEKHQGLKDQVATAHKAGRLRCDDSSIVTLKAQKLACKDQIAQLERELAALEAESTASPDTRAVRPTLTVVEGSSVSEPPAVRKTATG